MYITWTKGWSGRGGFAAIQVTCRDKRNGWHFEDRENKIKSHSSSKIQIEKLHKTLSQTKNTVLRSSFSFMQLSTERILISCRFNGLVFSIAWWRGVHSADTMLHNADTAVLALVAGARVTVVLTHSLFSFVLGPFSVRLTARRSAATTLVCTFSSVPQFPWWTDTTGHYRFHPMWRRYLYVPWRHKAKVEVWLH